MRTPWIILIITLILAGCTSGPGGEIDTVGDLKGKTIAVPGFATVQYFLALQALEGAGLSEGDVDFVATGSPAQMQLMLSRGEIDGFVAWEPYTTKTVKEGDGKVLIKSGDILKGHPCCILATRTAYLQDNSDTVERVLRAHIRATKFIQEHPEEAAEIFAKSTGYDMDVVRSAMSNIEYTYEPSIQGTREYVSFLLQKDKIENVGTVDAFLEDFFLPGLIETAKSGSPGGKEPVTVRLGYLQNDLHQLAHWVAKEKGYYRDEGITVEEKVYNNGGFEMDGFAGKEIDMGYLGTAPAVIKKANAGIDIKQVAQANNEGSAIIVR